MDKRMKKYLRGVRRRLELPADLKARVMADFISSIQSRLEDGMSDAQIIEELGTPKEAARLLNEQMKDLTFRKSPWRFIFGAAAIYGAARLLGSLISRVVAYFVGVSVAVRESATIGVIGGADGPTAVFVTAPRWTGHLVSLGALIVGVAGFLLLRRRRRK